MKLPKIFDYSRTVMWIGLVLVIYIFIILVDENSKNYQLRSKANQLTAQNEQLEGQIQELQNRIAYYNTDEYKEKVAREKLGLQKPGEQVVIIPNDTNQASHAEKDTSDSKSAKKSNFASWIDFLFGS